MTYVSAAIAPPSPGVGQSCYFARPQEGSDRRGDRRRDDGNARAGADADTDRDGDLAHGEATGGERDDAARERKHRDDLAARALEEIGELVERRVERSEEHTSELQSLMRISYAVFCLKKKTNISTINHNCYTY